MHPRPPLVTATLTIAGMTSVHAARAVYTSLAGVAGISRADVGLGKATIEHDGQATAEALTEAISLAGYEVTSLKETRRQLPMAPG